VILTLQTTTFGVLGGIPTYNRLMCRALNAFDGASDKTVLIGTDTPADLETRHKELPSLSLVPFSRNRRGFAQQTLKVGATRKIDLALIGHVNYAPLGAMLKRLQPSMRYGVILYGIDAWNRLPVLRRRALQKADFIISISDYTRRKAVQSNELDPRRTDLLLNALEWVDERGVGGPASAPAIQGTRLLSVCRLEESERYKGVDKVIEALPAIAEKVPDVQYLIVGGGSDLERHRRLAQDCGVADRVHFLGFLSEDDLRSAYANCHVFVLPSAGEGFGFVFLEAMKYAKAVVAANSGGAPEVVLDQVTGRLIEYEDKQALTSALIDLCLDSAKREQLGRNGYQRLQEHFTYPQFEQKLNEILVREMPASSFYRGRRDYALNAELARHQA